MGSIGNLFFGFGKNGNFTNKNQETVGGEQFECDINYGFYLGGYTYVGINQNNNANPVLSTNHGSSYSINIVFILKEGTSIEFYVDNVLKKVIQYHQHLFFHYI